MDSLEYFNRTLTLSPVIGNKEVSAECNVEEMSDVERDGKTKAQKQDIDTKRLPLPPSTTNLKAISAAALVAARRKVI